MNDGEEETPTKATQSQDGKDTARDATAYMLNLTREMEVTMSSREGSGQVRSGQVRSKRGHTSAKCKRLVEKERYLKTMQGLRPGTARPGAIACGTCHIRVTHGVVRISSIM